MNAGRRRIAGICRNDLFAEVSDNRDNRFTFVFGETITIGPDDAARCGTRRPPALH